MNNDDTSVNSSHLDLNKNPFLKTQNSKSIISNHLLLKLYSKPLFIFAFLAISLFAYFFIDQSLAVFIHHHRTSIVQEAVHYITLIGTGGFNFLAAFILLGAGFVFKSPKLKYFAAFLLLSLIAASLICDVLKISLGRARPTQWFLHGYYGFYFLQFNGSMWSFPSGHATLISTSMTAVSLCWPRYGKICFLVVLLVCASRIILEHHFLSDVLTGVFIGSGITVLIFRKLIQYLRWQSLFL